MLTERYEETINILPTKQIQVQKILIIERNGVEISRVDPHSCTYDPGNPTDGASQQVLDVIGMVWTPDVLAQWDAMRAEIKRIEDERQAAAAEAEEKRKAAEVPPVEESAQ